MHTWIPGAWHSLLRMYACILFSYCSSHNARVSNVSVVVFFVWFSLFSFLASFVADLVVCQFDHWCVSFVRWVVDGPLLWYIRAYVICMFAFLSLQESRSQKNMITRTVETADAESRSKKMQLPCITHDPRPYLPSCMLYPLPMYLAWGGAPAQNFVSNWST